MADVACQAGVDAGLRQHVVQQQGGGGLAVGAGDAEHGHGGVAAGELYLADHLDAPALELYHQRRRQGYAGALHAQVGGEHLVGGVAPLFVGDALALELFLILGGDGSGVGDQDVPAAVLGEHCGADAALSGAEHY